MPKPLSVSVEGVPQVNAALRRVGDYDKEKASDKAGRGLLPYVKGGTRTKTGALRDSWDVKQGAFINEQFYATFQEFGTVHIEPMNAIGKAAESHERELIDAFDREIQDAANKAGLGS